MKKESLLNRFRDDFQSGRLMFSFMSITSIIFLILIIWMIIDVSTGGKEINPADYSVIKSYVEDEPKLKSTVEKYLNDSIINRREFNIIRSEYVKLMKNNLGEKHE